MKIYSAANVPVRHRDLSPKAGQEAGVGGPPRYARQLLDAEAPKIDEPVVDSVSISEEGLQKSGNNKEELARIEREREELQKQLEQAREQGEAQFEAMMVKIKCLLIAGRIMHGHKVPKDDYRYLAKHDMGLYAKALSLRIEKRDPIKYDRLSEDEEEKTEAEDPGNIDPAQSGGGETVEEISAEVGGDITTG